MRYNPPGQGLMKTRTFGRVLACSILGFAFMQADDLPVTPKKPVTDVYHGVKIVDDYRWLEDFSDPAVRAWAAAENRHARAYLDALPERPALYEQIKRLRSYPSPRYRTLVSRHGSLFALKQQPPKEQPILVALA